MTETDLNNLLRDVEAGRLNVADALSTLKQGPFRNTNLGYATLDHHRSLRHRIGEVIYGESKTAEQIADIAEKLGDFGASVLATRLNIEKIEALEKKFGQKGLANRMGRTYILNPKPEKKRSSGEPYVVIVAAGTSDLFVAEEAKSVCIAMNVAFEQITDVGVTGMHRLSPHLETLQSAAAIVVIAGMEAALPTVLGGLVARPVIAVPTSVGYGASFGGLAALLGMLNSCAPGITVVNIDNGFSAAFAAANIALQVRDALGVVLAANQVVGHV